MEADTSRDLADLTVAFKSRGVVAFDLDGNRTTDGADDDHRGRRYGTVTIVVTRRSTE